MTPQRRAIVTEVMRTQGHISPSVIARTVQGEMPGVNASTVYRTLTLLEEVGVLSHSHLETGAEYHKTEEAEHVHLTCGRCGKRRPALARRGACAAGPDPPPPRLRGRPHPLRDHRALRGLRHECRLEPARLAVGSLGCATAPGRTRTAARAGSRPSAPRPPRISAVRPVGHDPPVVHHERPRAELEGVRQVVGDHQHRDVERAHDVGELAAARRVEVRRRLVEHEDLRVASPAPSPPPPGDAARSSGGGARGRRRPPCRPP